MKLVAFDLETATVLPDGAYITDVGISCAGTHKSDQNDPVIVYEKKPQISKNTAQRLVGELEGYIKDGYTIVTVNGCGFDFRILAEESGLYARCAHMAVGHVDLMLLMQFQYGWRVGLDAMLAGMGFDPKVKIIRLASGEKREFNGGDFPALWRQGEYKALLPYIRRDASGTLDAAQYVLRNGQMDWVNQKGKSVYRRINGFNHVIQLFGLPLPPTKWMLEGRLKDDPPIPSRSDPIEWIPPDSLIALGLSRFVPDSI